MPRADASFGLLRPPPSSPSTAPADDPSARSLEAVGVEAVLGAMIEQKRRASRPDFPSFDAAEIATALEARAHDDASDASDANDEEGPPESEEPRLPPKRSDAFLKAR